MNIYNYSSALDAKWLLRRCLENETLRSKLYGIEDIEITFAYGRTLYGLEDQADKLHSMGSVLVVNVEGISEHLYSEEFFERSIGTTFKEVVTILGLQDRYWRAFI